MTFLRLAPRVIISFEIVSFAFSHKLFYLNETLKHVTVMPIKLRFWWLKTKRMKQKHLSFHCFCPPRCQSISDALESLYFLCCYALCMYVPLSKLRLHLR